MANHERVVVKFKRDRVVAATAEADDSGAFGSDLGLQFKPMVRSETVPFNTTAAESDATAVDTSVFEYFVADVPDDADAEAMAAQLSQSEDVEFAYVMRPPPPPPQVNPADDPAQARQGYQKPAPLGIDAEYAWQQPGGTGTGMVIVDMEQGWDLTHPDLPPGIPITGHNHGFFDHGTAVLGELVAIDNAIACVGIAPGATARVTSLWSGPGPGDYLATAAVIVQAISTMSSGDVLLLEAGAWFPSSNLVGPCEVDPAAFDAIRLATSQGITVIEAAHNSGVDLDAYNDPIKGRFLDRTHAGFQDSGAIMIGAASSGDPHARLGFSNFGTRIDCYAWGENVTTTEPGVPGVTDFFSGTSSASPIVAGAAILTQSMAQARRGSKFSPAELRTILSAPANGTASQNGAADRIGVMPDLKKIVESVLQPAPAPDAYSSSTGGSAGGSFVTNCL